MEECIERMSCLLSGGNNVSTAAKPERGEAGEEAPMK